VSNLPFQYLSRRVDADVWRYLALPLTAVLTTVLALVTAAQADVPFRDPDGVLGRRVVLLFLGVGVCWAIDVVPRAGKRCGWEVAGMPDAMRAVVRERWNRRRTLAVGTGVVSFYVTYVAYRNIKSFLPLLAGPTVDFELLALDRSLTFGYDPASLLHTLLGTGIAAHLLSSVYVLYLVIVPISVGFALVWSTNLAIGAWYVTALSLNWLLGALSYYVLPSLGPAFVLPSLFADLPGTGAGKLQEVLLDGRHDFLAAPLASGKVQSIAAFASLHVSIVFTAALVAHLLRLPRWVRISLWSFLVLTFLSTVYFGWHYIIDDFAGLVIGALAVWLAYVLTRPRGIRLSPASIGAGVSLPGRSWWGSAGAAMRQRRWRSNQPPR